MVEHDGFDKRGCGLRVKNKPLYRIGDKTLMVKQWAIEWGCEYQTARYRIGQPCGRGEAVPVY